jgi:hypothetical protein
VKNLNSWSRLAGACLDARDALRRLIPELDRAIAAADTAMLIEIRELAIRHANALQRALKHPAPPRVAMPAPSARNAVLGGPSVRSGVSGGGAG